MAGNAQEPRERNRRLRKQEVAANQPYTAQTDGLDGASSMTVSLHGGVAVVE
jgi:hypothetical protein